MSTAFVCLKEDYVEPQTYIVTGTLTDQNTVSLDEALPITATKVRVTIETIKDRQLRPLVDVLAEIHERQRARGHTPQPRKK
jgi:hypothetical protein